MCSGVPKKWGWPQINMLWKNMAHEWPWNYYYCSVLIQFLSWELSHLLFLESALLANAVAYKRRFSSSIRWVQRERMEEQLDKSSWKQWEFLGEGQLDWLWREESESVEADKKDVRDCIGREKVWFVNEINSWLEWRLCIWGVRDSGLVGWSHHRPQTTKG